MSIVVDVAIQTLLLFCMWAGGYFMGRARQRHQHATYMINGWGYLHGVVNQRRADHFTINDLTEAFPLPGERRLDPSVDEEYRK